MVQLCISMICTRVSLGFKNNLLLIVRFRIVIAAALLRQIRKGNIQSDVMEHNFYGDYCFK